MLHPSHPHHHRSAAVDTANSKFVGTGFAQSPMSAPPHPHRGKMSPSGQGSPGSHDRAGHLPHGPPPGHYTHNNHVHQRLNTQAPSPQMYAPGGVRGPGVRVHGNVRGVPHSHGPHGVHVNHPGQRSQSMVSPSSKPMIDVRGIELPGSPMSDMSSPYDDNGADSDEELEFKTQDLPPYLQRPPTPPRRRYVDPTEEDVDDFDLADTPRQSADEVARKKRVHFGRTRVKATKKSVETPKTLRPDDIDNLLNRPKLLQMCGITDKELKRLQQQQHKADENGCLPGKVLTEKSAEERAKSDPLGGNTTKDGRPIRSILANKELPINQVRYNQFLPARHQYEAEYVAQIAKGSWVTKYNQRGKPTKRWFSLSSDHSELLWASGKRNIKRRRRVNLTDLIDIIPGKGFPRFAYSEVPSWLCVTLIFTTRHMHLSFANIDLYMAWFLGLQSLAPMSQCDMTRGMLIWYRAIWKLDDDAAGIPRNPEVWNYPANMGDGPGARDSPRRFGARKNRQLHGTL